MQEKNVVYFILQNKDVDNICGNKKARKNIGLNGLGFYLKLAALVINAAFACFSTSIE